MGKKIDLTGQIFGRLLVIKENGRSNGKVRWDCVCDCGNESNVASRGLIIGDTKSCGCLSKNNATTHGLSTTPEYNAWKSMKNRCYETENKRYKDYGGRGIKICDRWHNIENFIEDMGKRPSKNHSVDRIDNNKGYEPGSCRWSTSKEQGRNKRTNRLVTIDGETKCLKDWAETLNVNYVTINVRIFRGLDPITALTKPIQSKNHA